MTSLTKTEAHIKVCTNGAFHIKQNHGWIEVGMGTDEMGPVSRPLTEDERVELLQALDVSRELAAGWDAIEENKQLRERIDQLHDEGVKLRRVLRLLRDFTDHATQWTLGCRTHPIWTLVVETLGSENRARPSQKEWAFLWPGNTEPLA